jgi:putative ABC transport system permease protein
VIEGRETEYSSQPEIAVRPVSPGYFRAVGVPLRRGRLLTEQDGVDGADVLLINEAAARRFFRGVDPVGHRVEFWGRSRSIVGVVGDERFRGLAEAASPAVYPPVRQTPMATASLLVHTRGSPAGLARALEDAVHAIDPELAVFEVETLDRALAASVARPRFTAGVLGGFAALAVLLASLGIHALLTYLVTQRTRELGIRLALGASRSAMLSSVVGRGLGLALAGAVIGLLAAVALGGLLRGLLFGVGEHDPLVLAGAPLLLLSIRALASWLPARRATAVDPMIALRSE